MPEGYKNDGEVYEYVSNFTEQLSLEFCATLKIMPWHNPISHF